MGPSESVIVEESIYVGFKAGTAPVAATESALVSRLKAGEREAFEELISSYQSLVFGLAYRLVGDREDARDVAQETFLKAYRNIGSFRSECALKTWLYRITINQASNHQRWWRRRRRKQTVSLDSSNDESDRTLGDHLASSGRSPEQVTLGREREGIIHAALDQIKADFRVAVVLRDIEELSYEEIAELLDVPIGTVKSRIARGREELRKRLEKVGF